MSKLSLSTRCRRVLATAALAALLPAPRAAAQVNVVITADNAYMLGFGSSTNPALVTWLPGVENNTAGQIFNCSGGPETYSNLNPGVADFLYIVTYSDDAVTQGVLGRFTLVGGRTVFTGGAGWQVHATGQDVDLGSGGVSPATASAIVTAASTQWQGLATATTAGVATGELNNSAAGIFPLVCTSLIPQGARWMWYSSQPPLNAFNQNPPGGGGHREFLIFRLPVRALMCPCRPGPLEPTDANAPDRVGRPHTLRADSTPGPDD